MAKFLSLTKVLLKCSMGMLTDGKSKKGMSIFLYSIIALSCLPLAVVFFFMVRSTLDVLGSIGQAGSALGSMMFLACFLIFIFSIFIIPSIFYFSSDSNILLSLPLKPEQIIGSKFVVCLVYEYMFGCAVMIPTFAAYIDYAGVTLPFLIGGVLSLILVPIFPLVLGTILTILMMRFVPFFKNRDRFNLIAGVLTLILAFGFSFFMNSMDPGDGNTQAMMQSILQGNNSLLEVFMKFFPMIPFFIRGMVDGNYLQLLIGITIVVISVVVLLTLGKFLYFKGAIGYGETSSSRKKLSDSDLHKANRSHSKIRTYAVKEMKILVRTPVYFLNCIAMCIVMPLLVLMGPTIAGSKGDAGIDMDALLSLANEIPNFTAYLIILGLAVGFLVGGMNMISSTAISREGSNYTYMKYIPMSYQDQIHAKAYCGIFMSIVTLVLTIIPLYLFLPLPILNYLIVFGCSIISAIIVNFLGIIIDLSHPKLVWEQEAAAVKQNLGGVLSIFGGVGLCAVMIALCFFISNEYIMILAISFIAFSLLLAVALYMISGRYAEKAMKKL